MYCCSQGQVVLWRQEGEEGCATRSLAFGRWPSLTSSLSLALTVKTPTEEKPQPVVDTPAAATEPTTLATEAPATVTAPETVAAAEATASASAPVPHVVEPVSEPSEEQVKESAEAEKPVAGAEGAEEKKDEVKADESVRCFAQTWPSPLRRPRVGSMTECI